MKAVIPPPIVLLICGLLMWLADRLAPHFYFSIAYRGIVFWIIFLGGLSVFGSGVVNIVRRKTTIHPDRRSLAKATALVTTGIFRYTRNPIYLGMAVILTAWVIYLQNWLTLLGVIAFVVFITEYQIKPEEAALDKIFADEYLRYKKRVRRWV